ncbi:MAG: glycosyltransferase family 39 protein [Planctomycetota bacterium]
MLLLLATVLRTGTNLSRVDEYFQEGLVRGTLAEAWLKGAPVWLREAPQIPHIRGSVVMSLISVPAFVLLGPTTFAVRISGILFHLAGLATLMLLMHRLFGRRVAVLAGALFVLAPPSLAKIAVLSYGDHIESLPFVFAAAWAMLAWVEDRSGRRPALGLVAGLLIGLGMSWHAQARLAVLALLAACALIAPRRMLRRDAFTGLAPGLLLGLVPLAIGDWITAQQGLLVFGAGPADVASQGITWEHVAKWIDFWLVDLAHALQFEWFPAAVVLLLLAAGCALGLAVRAVRAVRAGADGLADLAGRSAFFIVYPLVFSVVYALSRFAVQHELDNAIQVRYVLPVVPVLLLPIPIAAGRLWDASRRVAAALVLVPALLLGTWGTLSTWDVDTMLHEPARHASSFEFFGTHLAHGTLSETDRTELRALALSLYGNPEQDARVRRFLDSHADPDGVLALIERLDDQPSWTWPLRFGLPLPYPDVRTATRHDEMRERFLGTPPRFRPFVAFVAARHAARSRRFDAARANALLRMESADDERRLFLRGIGHGVMSAELPRFLDGRIARSRIAALSPGLDLAEVAFGAGLRVGQIVNAFYPPGDRLLGEFLTHMHADLHPPFVRGVGAAYRWRFLDPPERGLQSPAVARLLALLPTELESPFRDGLGGSDDAR